MVSEIARFYCKPDLTSSRFLRQGAPQAILHDGFWKGDPDFIFMFNWHFLSILNGLEFIRLFFIWLGFPYWWRNFGSFWTKWPPKRQIRKKHLLGGPSLRQTASFEPMCVKLSLSVWIEKKAGRKEEKSQKVYISRMCGATPSGRMQPNLAYVFISRT